ncbi:MAG: hypothetical protein JWO67_1330 [Streptosporangiaceae bacterium]|nr:hypothetical protein [Streptosporangiaceae bacterium]
MPPLPTQITEADNVKHEIHYTLADRPYDVVVAAYTTIEDDVVKFFNHLHRLVALVPVQIVALIKRLEADIEGQDGPAEARRSRSRRGSGDDE